MATYTATLFPDNSTSAHFLGWAGSSTGISYALGQLGFVLQADTYTAQWAASAVIGAPAQPIVAGALNGTAFGTVAANQRTQVPAANFMGAYASGTTYSKGQVVTFTVNSEPLVYMFINGTPTAGQAPMSYSSPNYTLNSTYWTPYYMEVWKMASGSLNTAYIKIEYGCGTTSVNDPCATISIGGTYSTGSSGYLTGNFTLPQLFLLGTGSNSGASYPCYFSGDGGSWLNMAMFPSGASNAYTGYVGIERFVQSWSGSSITYESASATLMCGAGTLWYQENIYLTGSPASGVRNAWVSAAYTGQSAINNYLPACPVFPVDGAFGNPLTLLLAPASSALASGNTAFVYTYGAVHTYMTVGTYPWQYFNDQVSYGLLRWE